VTRARLWLSALVALAAAACGGGRATPLETLDTIRSSVAVSDALRFAETHDRTTRAHRRQMMRDFRALLERGDDPKVVLASVALKPEEVTAGTLDEAVGRLFLVHSPFVREQAWFRDATPVGAVEYTDEDHATVRLRGSDGVERNLYFIREDGRWALDHAMTWRPQ
jgi:hypothetical protein